MATPVDPNRPVKADAQTPCTCTPPGGGGWLPAGSAPGDLLYWDGFNWVVLHYPSPGSGQILTAGSTGLFWANP